MQFGYAKRVLSGFTSSAYPNNWHHAGTGSDVANNVASQPGPDRSYKLAAYLAVGMADYAVERDYPACRGGRCGDDGAA